MKAAPSNTSRRTRSTALIFGIAALIVAGLSITSVPAYAETTYVVNSNGDQTDPNPGDGNCGAFGQCTLRAAIQDANAHPGPDKISFNISAFNINPNSELPVITEQVTVDGYTQPDSSPNTLREGNNARIGVQLNGRSAGLASGLNFDDSASNSVVRGLSISEFSQDGIAIFGATNVRIEGNRIGTGLNGISDEGNRGDGVLIRSTVGSIGDSNIIGGTAPAQSNLISGNESNGVFIFESPNNIVQGNYIGTDVDGTGDSDDDMGNSLFGVEVRESSGNVIGGSVAGADNLISNNDRAGIILDEGSGNKVLANRIGTDRTGTKGLSNHNSGVEIVGSSSNRIGDGTVAGSNIIAFNDRSGIEIGETGGQPGSANGNAISHNSIFSNGDFSKGISLSNSNLPIPNDPKDVDSGANRLQNSPVLSLVKTSTTGTMIVGKLSSTPNATFSVEFYSNPKNTDEGKTYLGKKTVPTDSNGNGSFSFKTNTRLAAGLNVTATATRLFLGPTDTSEFSLPKKVAADFKPPRVISVSPANGASGVPATANVIATFNEAMQPSTIGTNTVRLKKAGSTASVAAKVSYNKSKKQAILNPSASLKSGATYTVLVSTGARDFSGNALDQDPKAKGNQAKTWKFTAKK